MAQRDRLVACCDSLAQNNGDSRSIFLWGLMLCFPQDSQELIENCNYLTIVGLLESDSQPENSRHLYSFLK